MLRPCLGGKIALCSPASDTIVDIFARLGFPLHLIQGIPLNLTYRLPPLVSIEMLNYSIGKTISFLKVCTALVTLLDRVLVFLYCGYMADYPEITQRQAKILAAIVKENCDTGVPVASKDLVDKDYFDLSGASIRNEMQVLEKLGYIKQPHTSAGRVPTDMGFRYFVSELMERVKLSMKEQEHLRREVIKLQAAQVEMGRRLAKLTAEISGDASFALFPEDSSAVGISNLLANPQLSQEDAQAVAEFFDNIDEKAPELIREFSGDGSPRTVIGSDIKEIALSQGSDYSMIVSGLSLPSGKKGVLGLIGPKAMKYEKNLSVMEYISKLIGGGGKDTSEKN